MTDFRPLVLDLGKNGLDFQDGLRALMESLFSTDPDTMRMALEYVSENFPDEKYRRSHLIDLLRTFKKPYPQEHLPARLEAIDWMQDNLQERSGKRIDISILSTLSKSSGGLPVDLVMKFDRLDYSGGSGRSFLENLLRESPEICDNIAHLYWSATTNRCINSPSDWCVIDNFRNLRSIHIKVGQPWVTFNFNLLNRPEIRPARLELEQCSILPGRNVDSLLFEELDVSHNSGQTVNENRACWPNLKKIVVRDCATQVNFIDAIGDRPHLFPTLETIYFEKKFGTRSKKALDRLLEIEFPELREVVVCRIKSRIDENLEENYHHAFARKGIKFRLLTQ